MAEKAPKLTIGEIFRLAQLKNQGRL